ncbi:MAG: YdcF family protein [Actinomycetota bacterium]
MGFVRRHPVLVTLLAVVLVLFSVLAASAVSVWRAAHTDEARRIDSADIILVLGAAQYGGIPSPVFRGRLEHAALLYQKDFADRLMVLGAGQPGDELTESEAGGRYLSALGVPDENILYSPHGNTTQESLEQAATIMGDQGLDSAFLVSDPWHNLRIRRMARDLGIEGYVSATWHSAAKSQATRLSGYVRETFAYLFYRFTGR